MKFGAHSFLFTDRWDDSHLPLLETAYRLGLDCFEIATGDDVEFTYSRTRRAAETHGLELTVGPGGLWPVSCDLSSDDEIERAKGLAWHKRQVEIASELGAVAYTGALYGHPGTVKRRIPPAGEFDRVAEGLHLLTDYAAHLGVRIVIEPMSHFRTHLVNTPDQAVRLLDQVDHANLAILLDTYHMVTEVRDFGAAVWVVGDRLWGFHACENDRGVPGGGLVPWQSLFTAAHATGFDGYVIMESYNSSIGDFAFRRGMFHDVCPDGAAFVRQGLEFLKAGLGKQSMSNK